jgi:hypothetical protein
MRAWLIVLLAATVGGAAVFAQRGGPPPVARDATTIPRSPNTAAGRLSGRVLSGDAGRPLRRVVVQLTTGNLQTARWTSTDEHGRWQFSGVSPGAYTITASRDGYVTMAFGQKGPFGAPATVSLLVDQVRDSLDIELPPGAVVTGRIVDDLGDPVGGALVQVLRLTFVDGLRQLVPVHPGLSALSYGGLTDDRGEYRLYGLASGTYYLSATYGRTAPGQSDDRVSYATTYHPGTASVAGAGALKVVAGEAATASFALSLTSLAELSGRVVSSLGQPVPASVSLVAVAPGHAVEAGSRLMVNADSSGVFTLKSVPTGSYFLQARAGAGSGSPEVAALQVAVAGQDLRDIVVTTAAAGSVSGRLVLEDAPPDLRPDGFFIAALPAGPGAMSARPAAAQGRANAAGTFLVAGISGRHVLRLRNPPVGWWLKSVTVDGVDVTDAGSDFAGGQTIAVDVVATRRMAALSGVVRDVAGQPVSECSVVAFSPNESKWGPRTRFIAATAADKDGTFAFSGLVPGEYVVVAVPPLDAGEETDPDRLSRWRTSGRRLSLSDVQSPVITLTVTR